MTVSEITPFIPEMEKYKVSEVARGVKESTATEGGFLQMYQKIQAPMFMYDIPVKPGAKETWGQRRDNFVSRHYAQYQSNPTYRRRLALIAWAFDPEKQR